MLPFTGRDALLGEISAAADRARAGRGGLVLLTGAAGAGKTRLAAEAVARLDGVRVVWAWCPPGDDREAFAPWSLVVRELVAQDADGLAGRSPAIQGLIGGRTAQPALASDPEGARIRLTGEVAQLLRACAETAPVVVVLDDLHAADPSTVRLLLDLTATARTSRLMFLGTCREHQLTASLLSAAVCLPVGPLSHQDVEVLLAAAHGRPPAADDVRALLDRTGGDAFLVTELLRAGPGVPASVRAAVEARIASLPSPRVVGAAAVLGTRVRLDVLAELVDVGLGELRPLFDAAAGLLVTAGPGEVRFLHELLRDAVYDALPSAERVALHVRAGEVLARFAERGRAAGSAEVAHHLMLAGPEHAEEAGAFARRAGDEAAAMRAYDDALRWYDRAAQATGSDAELLVAQGNARLGSGDRVGARADFLAAARKAGDRGDLLARAALGLGGMEVDLLDREQIDLLVKAREALPGEESALRAVVVARLSVATTLIESDEHRIALTDEALELAHRSGDEAALAQVLAARCDALSGPEHVADRLGWATRIVSIAQRLPDLGLELLGRRLRQVALLESGAVPAADAEVLAFEAAARPLGSPLHDWYVPLWRGMRALAEGRFDDCAEHLAVVEEIGQGRGNAAMLATTQRWFLLSDTRDATGMAEMIAEAHLELVPGVWPSVTLALVATQLGHLDEARDRLSAVAGRLADAPRDSEWLPMLSQVAETVAVIGEHPVSRVVYDWMLPFAGLYVVEGIGAALRGPVSWYLSLLAKAFGDDDLARTHAATALEAARRACLNVLVKRIESDHEPATGEHVFAEDGEIWVLRYAGQEARLTTSKGMRDLATLLERPGSPVSAADLMGAVSAGDLGDVLDATARSAYQRRLHELTAEADEADADGDAERSARLAVERDALVQQLTSAYGLGGRVRKAGSASERARTAVTARIRATIDRIARAHPELGRHLRASVRTGTVCVYEPETPRRWTTSHRAMGSHA
ncbi:hypothetical protein UK23_17680 [Lentzea aerocolonigenes]|uniref:AAA+ ATPase domain-containing protein n=1 Tax=Lentzea aerocolonigenes TaxID=68170 RepID=A0A0F0H3L5_LENAE|nr:AAA family ATPase [Lentzea aerocolonigenes]KJK48223.1 hypothetical protein UK23_17680 [Lentzea aerocolonigenes]